MNAARRLDVRPHVDFVTGQTDVPCPQCGAPVVFTTRRVLCRTGCRWGVELAPAEADDFLAALLGWDADQPHALDPALFLQVVATRCTPPPDPPGRLLHLHPRPTTRKLRIVPVPDETPEARGARLAEQADCNEVAVEPDPAAPGCYRATSQERWLDDGTPVTTYHLWPRGESYRCSCPAAGPCAHIQAVERYVAERAAAALPVFGARDRAERLARAKAATDLLWG